MVLEALNFWFLVNIRLPHFWGYLSEMIFPLWTLLCATNLFADPEEIDRENLERD